MTPPNIEAVRKALKMAEVERHSRFACIYPIAYTGMRRGEAMKEGSQPPIFLPKLVLDGPKLYWINADDGQDFP